MLYFSFISHVRASEIKLKQICVCFISVLFQFYSDVSAALGKRNRPAEYTEYEIEYEEWAEDDETDEIDPWPAVSHSVVYLHSSTRRNDMKPGARLTHNRMMNKKQGIKIITDLHSIPNKRETLLLLLLFIFILFLFFT